MKWEHLQQWRAEMRSHISKRLAERQLVAGSGVVIDGSMISIEPVKKTPPIEVAETWGLKIWGYIRGDINGTPIDTGYLSGGTVNRITGELNVGEMWPGTEHHNLTAEEGPPSIREITLELQVRAFDNVIESLSFEAGYYRVPVRLTMELRAYYGPGSQDYEVRSTFTETIRRQGWSRHFTAPSPDLKFKVYPVVVQRLA